MLRCFLCVLLLATGALAYPATVLEVDWANVPSSTPVARNLDSPYLGDCVCDVTRDICDPYCCCDEDCDAAAQASFSYCLPEQYSAPYLDYCYPTDRATSLQRINNIEAIYIDKKMQGYSAVCVIRTNHPGELYRYFRVPTSVQQPALPKTIITQVPTGQPYAVGDPLVTAKYAEIDGAAAYRRVTALQLPTTAADGSCGSVGRSVGFLDSVSGVACSLNGAQLCARFSLSKYEGLFLQRLLGYNSTDLALVPVILNVLNTSGSLLATLSPTDTSDYVTYTDGVTCLNAILDFHAYYSYAANYSGNLTAAVVNITIADIGLAQYTAVTFAATFVADNATAPSSLISATPGYLAGNRVRAGTLVTLAGKSAILERESGFAVPSGGRLCTRSQWKRSNFMFSILSSGCWVEMNETALQSVCATGTESLIASLVNVTVGGTSILLDRIAMTNDALTNDTTSWIAVDGLSAALTPSPGTYSTYTRRCENVTVGLQYQFVVARAGAEYNPQDVIVGAFASPITGSLQMHNDTDVSGSALSLQSIVFKVTYSRYDPDSQATIMRRVVAPPILPRLDDTIFYPFRRPYPL